jgi:hypothetical protein
VGVLERFPAKACPGLDPGWIPGSREENASNKEVEHPFRFDRNGKGFNVYETTTLNLADHATKAPLDALTCIALRSVSYPQRPCEPPNIRA